MILLSHYCVLFTKNCKVSSFTDLDKNLFFCRKVSLPRKHLTVSLSSGEPNRLTNSKINLQNILRYFSSSRFPLSCLENISLFHHPEDISLRNTELLPGKILLSHLLSLLSRFPLTSLFICLEENLLLDFTCSPEEAGAEYRSISSSSSAAAM